MKTIGELQRQLAYEREKVIAARKLQQLTEDNQIRWMQNCEKLEKQLAAEREKAGKVIGAYAGIADERERQLAAAVSALKVSRKQLSKFNHIYATAGIEHIDATLKKIEQK